MDSSSENDKTSGLPDTDLTITVNHQAAEIIRRLARHFATPQVAVVEASVVLLQDRVDGFDVLQIPELIAGIADLEETVNQLVCRADQFERLAHELAALEALRGPSA